MNRRTPPDPHAAVRYERSAREIKASRLAGVVPWGETPEANVAAAAELAGWPQADRNRLALLCGVRPPSEETWTLVVLHVANRGRKPAND